MEKDEMRAGKMKAEDRADMPGQNPPDLYL
jgi:hypothetical protein